MATSTTTTHHPDLGSALRHYRKLAGLSLEHAGVEVGRSSHTIREWEIGNRIPSRLFLTHLAELYKVGYRELLDSVVPGR